MRTHVDLFSGIGGFALACEWAGVETIAFAETEPYASRVLQRHWPEVRNYGDVREFPSLSAWLLTAGVPCQPASIAGKRRGAADDRWLWPATLAVIENGAYEWLLLENPTGILSLNDGVEFERICASLESQGYEVQPLVIPACGVGALHRRNRVWILAHASIRKDNERGRRIMAKTKRRGEGGDASVVACGEDVPHTKHARPSRARRRDESKVSQRSVINSSTKDVADAPRARVNRAGRAGSEWRSKFTDGSWWDAEPDVGRLANGVSDRVGKLRGLGNAIVPQVAYQLIKRMVEVSDQSEVAALASYIEQASETVKKWPEWKQNLL